MDTPRHRAFTGIALCVLTVLFAAPPTPALGHEPTAHRQLSPSHFNGEVGGDHGPDVPGETNESQSASDTFDGVDSAFSLRSIASLESLYYEWYDCPDNGNPFTGQCAFIARDTTPTLSQAPSAAVPQVASFEATYDIPATPSGGVIRGVACIDGPPARPAHCRVDAINMHLDDASSTADHPATDNGQITQPTHGGAVANTGFTAMAFTNESDIGRILFCLDAGTSPTTPEDASPGQGCSPGSAADATPDDAPCGPVPAGADCWSVSIDPPDDIEFSLGIVEQDEPLIPPAALVSSGAGDCEGDTFQPPGGDGANDGDDCQLDKIYLTSKAQPAPPGGPGPGPQARCPGFQGDTRNQVVGTASADVLNGTSGPDIICGLGGNDTIRGLGGKDILIGGSGADVLLGARGSDRLTGGRGQDTLRGGGGNDRLTGSGGHDTLRGGRGKDVLRGMRGRDVLRGGPGRDRLLGGPGRDLCSGGPGADVVRGCER
jgi:RTX calcium-binding nonapeptide repeat (4 copies)